MDAADPVLRPDRALTVAERSGRVVFNPNEPPRDVRWGERTVDGMRPAATLYTTDERPK